MCLSFLKRLFPIALGLCFLHSAEAQREPTPVFVQNTKFRPLVEKLEALGTLRANEATTLSASVTEIITVVHFDDNQRVEQGDVLVEMTSAEEHAQLEQAISALDEAERQLARVKALAKTSLATAAQLDQQRGLVDSARAQLRGVQSRLQDRLILAPFKGVVGLRNISVGALVRPGDVITTLDDDSVMKLDMHIPAIHFNHLQLGMKIQAKAAAYNNKTFTGELASIDSRIDPTTRSVIVRALIPNAEGMLRPGMLMTVTLNKPERQVLLVAEEAITQVGRQSFVYVVNARAQPPSVTRRQVTLGVRQKGIVEIVDGLSVDQTVVVHGGMKLREGAIVAVKATLDDGQRLSDLLAQ